MLHSSIRVRYHFNLEMHFFSIRLSFLLFYYRDISISQNLNFLKLKISILDDLLSGSQLLDFRCNRYRHDYCFIKICIFTIFPSDISKTQRPVCFQIYRQMDMALLTQEQELNISKLSLYSKTEICSSKTIHICFHESSFIYELRIDLIDN